MSRRSELFQKREPGKLIETGWVTDSLESLGHERNAVSKPLDGCLETLELNGLQLVARHFLNLGFVESRHHVRHNLILNHEIVNALTIRRIGRSCGVVFGGDQTHLARRAG